MIQNLTDIRKVKFLGYGISISFLIIHIILLMMFSYFGVVPMAIFNVFSIAFYILSFLIVKKGNLWIYSVTVHLEVVLHMSLAVIFTGAEAGFQITLIGLNALAFFAEYMSVKLKKRRVAAVALGIFGMIMYIATYAYSQYFPAAYCLPHRICFLLQIAWAVIVFTIDIFFLELFVTTTIQSERNIHVVQTLAEAIDAKDTYTKGHSGRVAEYAREIAKRAGMNEKMQNEIYMMGLLHDVGKIGVPDAVINKPGRLSDEEFSIIKKHTDTGARILEKIEEMPELALGAHWHHERVDGKGYPGGMKGTQIPVEARIIAVADAYDAMTSSRSYRHAMSQSEVRQEIEQGLGTQFDSEFGKIMIEMIDEDTEFHMREI